jgi:DNA polymerase III subunit gamma/tau
MSESTLPDMSEAPAAASGSYQVLARKYRPQTFDDLIGQEAMVRTLSNAFAADRIAHGFILTGVRGVGKTTTARIIAKGLNCVGPDGKGGPTVKPCGECEFCTAIAESRHVDVLEMDAASRTGIDDIREIIESVRYRPAAARYKVYIIDEVHMLSRQAFNGLLKTLEEPPPHVKFIFATTEIRKVPVTVLSRCQRFDLRRIEADTLIAHLRAVTEAEGASAEPDALAILARAAEGSARDALSLLDQALAHGARGAGGGITVTEEEVRSMLGLVDRARVIDLIEKLFAGDAPGALGELRAQYEAGADPLTILNDLLELTHWLTRLKVVPEAAKDSAVSEVERERGGALAGKLSMPVLTRAWQMLLKGLQEAQSAPHALAAAEMVLIRLAYAATLKTPDELVRALEEGAPPAAASSAPAGRPSPSPAADVRAHHMAAADRPQADVSAPHSGTRPRAPSAAGPSAMARAAMPEPETPPAAAPETAAPLAEIGALEDMAALADRHRDIRLKLAIEDHLHLIRLEPGRLECRLADAAPSDLVERLRDGLSTWTGSRWVITLSNAGGAPTIREQREAARSAALAQIRGEPLVKNILEAFPGGQFGEITDIQPPDEADGVDSDSDDD